MEIRVNQQRCGASGLCARIAPAVFELDDDGVSHVRADVPADVDRDAVNEAVIACPTGAISVREGAALESNA